MPRPADYIVLYVSAPNRISSAPSTGCPGSKVLWELHILPNQASWMRASFRWEALDGAYEEAIGQGGRRL